jgi:hypothetical protein
MEPWKPAEVTAAGDAKEKKDASSPSSSQERKTGRSFLLEDTFSSTGAYEHTYLELAAAIVTLSRYANCRCVA